MEPIQADRRLNEKGENMKRIILLILAIFLTACSFTQTNELGKNQDKWTKAAITHYRYSLNVSCFCAFRNDMPVSVEVQDGKVILLTSATGTVIESTDPLFPTLESYSTVEGLFLQLKSAIGTAEKVSTVYDATYGFPNSIAIDQVKAAVDDELYITVENFEVLK